MEMNKYRRDFFYSTNYKLEFEIANYEADDIGLETIGNISFGVFLVRMFTVDLVHVFCIKE